MEHFNMRTITRTAMLLTIVGVFVDAGHVQHSNARVARAINDNTCELPPQPQNGRWKLHRLHCADEEECDVQSGTTELPLGSRLVYSCNAGYKMRGDADVSCTLGKNWRTIPDCIEIQRFDRDTKSCKGLNSPSVSAKCRSNATAEWVQCENTVLPGTQASLQCRDSYRPEIIRSLIQRSNVICNDNGLWEPQPLRCVPECGLLPSDTPLSSDSVQPNTTVFPWHASIYRDYPGQPKRFLCGATIIQENLLITAAHCVSFADDRKHINVNDLYVMTGNIYHDYDSPLHNDAVVKKAKVKNIYIGYNYQGYKNNYSSDIAILELVEPFVLSASLLPACIDFSVDDLLVMDNANVYGKIASLGDRGATLQSLSLPYIPYNQCLATSKNFGVERFITQDKFCAGYTNGTSVCLGDSGNGLVFQNSLNGRWFLRGIVSVAPGLRQDRTSVNRCDYAFHTYSLFTRLSRHIEWIQKVIISLDLKRPYLL